MRRIAAFTMKDSLLPLLILPLWFVGTIIVITTFNVLKMSQPEKMLIPVAGWPTTAKHHPLYAAANAWAASHGFPWAGAYTFANINVLGWEQPSTMQMFCIYFNTQGTTISEFIPRFADDTGLTTSNTRDTFFLPSRSGIYKQAFLGRSYQDLFQIHAATEAYFQQVHGKKFAPKTLSLLPAMIESITRQMKHIRSLPLWPIRSVRWYLINRFTIPNRSVRELYFELRG